MEAVESLKTYTLIGYFCPKHIKFYRKKYRRGLSYDTEEWCKVWRKTDSWIQKWHEEFDEFWPNTRKSQNLHFKGLLLIQVYNVWAKKLQRKHVSWH